MVILINYKFLALFLVSIVINVIIIHYFFFIAIEVYNGLNMDCMFFI